MIVGAQQNRTSAVYKWIFQNVLCTSAPYYLLRAKENSLRLAGIDQMEALCGKNVQGCVVLALAVARCWQGKVQEFSNRTQTNRNPQTHFNIFIQSLWKIDRRVFLFVFKSHGRRKGKGKQKMSRIQRNDSVRIALINPTSHLQKAFRNTKRT